MTDTVQEIAFRYAVDRVNSDRDVLPRSRLTAQIERIPQQDSFYASKQGNFRVFKLLLDVERGERQVSRLIEQRGTNSFQSIKFFLA